MINMRILFRLLTAISVCMVLLPAQAQAQVDNFSITDYQIEYHLSRDEEQRSALKTTETITADFRVPNQNRGIERAIPKDYDGHPTSLELLSVQDESGNDRQYSTYSSGGNLVVRIGDPNRYVIGKQTYVITYTQRDVTKYFANTGRDEFYWDTNGTQWRVPIERFSVSLLVDEALQNRLIGDTACYQGAQGSSQTCEVTQGAGRYTASATNLKRYENLTLAIGFLPETFAAYEMPLWQRLLYAWIAVQVLLLIISIGIIIWLAKRYSSWSSRRSEITTIVPEYLPPKGISVTTSAMLLESRKGIAAQIIDLAVRHYLKIYQTRDASKAKAAEYKIELANDISTLLAEEQELVKDMYGRTPKTGKTLQLKTLQQSAAFQSRLADNPKKLEKLIRGAYGLRHKDPEKTAWFMRTGRNLLLLSALLLSPVLLIAAVTARVMGDKLWPLTDKGVGLMRYLEGLKHYISVAEKERLQLLQSPEGAAKVGVSGQPDNVQLIKLYERVLPYAILFGQEKQWNAQLVKYYEQQDYNPGWLLGPRGTLLGSAAFTAAISDISTTRYASSSYSSAGGSSGGGFSGGGGGGGGGGGW